MQLRRLGTLNPITVTWLKPAGMIFIGVSSTFRDPVKTTNSKVDPAAIAPDFRWKVLWAMFVGGVGWTGTRRHVYWGQRKGRDCRVYSRQRTGHYLGALFLVGTGGGETPGALFIGDSGRAESVATFGGEYKDPWPPRLLGSMKESETQEHRRLGGDLEVDSVPRRGPVPESRLASGAGSG